MIKLREACLLFIALCAIVVTGCGQESQAPTPAGSADTPAGTGGAVADKGPALDELLAQADVKRGQTLFLQCRACHSLGEGEAHKVGPNLYGIFGRQAGQAPGFDYSDALQEADLVWDAAALDAWLERPSEFLPGNRMVFIGVRSPADRANVIAYLQQATAAE